MKTVAIIQARMGSTRLPGKVLKILQNKTVLGHVIERLTTVKHIDEVIVATTALPQDQAIEDEVRLLGIPYYRGSEDDVLSRYYEAAARSSADIIVRVTSDCPLIEPSIVESVIDLLKCSKADYASNALVRTFPRGLDVEAFTMQAISQAYHEATRPEQREHVTPYLYQNPNLFKLVDYTHPLNFSHYRWTLDTIEDWELITEIYNRLYNQDHLFSWNDAIRLMEQNPELSRINGHIEQKKLTQ